MESESPGQLANSGSPGRMAIELAYVLCLYFVHTYRQIAIGNVNLASQLLLGIGAVTVTE